jgi:hypothetical protein
VGLGLRVFFVAFGLRVQGLGLRIQDLGFGLPTP